MYASDGAEQWRTLMCVGCTMRSNYYGETLGHLFTSRQRINNGHWQIICSWCTHAESVEERHERFREGNDELWALVTGSSALSAR